VKRREEEKQFRRPKLRGEENIKMDIQEVGWAAWNGLIWHRTGTGGGFL
jgi:hypothetical protein